MAILKCKMCGGELNIVEGSTVCECEYCGSKQTVPKFDDEKKITLYERANRLRFNCEFDKAATVYEQIVAEFHEEAESYWGLLLCNYGIEYVDDPATGKKVPTCHRSSFECVLDDSDFEMVMEYSDSISRQVYREQAKEIEEIRKGIIKVSGKEEPYDIFICYKETDENGERTIDSVIAQEVYDELTTKGYRVFFSRISLEDKLGTEYEPYIFAALNSAKIMLAFGTQYDYYQAVWVKNEWSRFLKLMAKDKNKHLIPCFKNLDAYDIPKEFAHLQAQDMGKVGAMQDLLRGIDKILNPNATVKTIVQTTASNSVLPLLKRGNIALEDGDWEKADEYFDEVLNQDAENAEAYLGRLLAENKVVNFEEYINQQKNKYSNVEQENLEAWPEDSKHIDEMILKYIVPGYLEENDISEKYNCDRKYSSVLSSSKLLKVEHMRNLNNDKVLSRVRQYTTGDLKQKIESGISEIEKYHDDRITKAQEEDNAKIEQVKMAYAEHLVDTDEKIKKLNLKAKANKEADYQACIKEFAKCKNVSDYQDIKKEFILFGNYQDSKSYIEKCNEEEEKAKNKKKRKITTLWIAIGAVIVAIILVFTVLIPLIEKNKFISKYSQEAYDVFGTIDIKKGNTITFGSYQGEPVEWRILDVDGDKALIITEMGIDTMPYNNEDGVTTWETCSLRKYMNSTMLNELFSTEEQKIVVKVVNNNPDNSKYGTKGGIDTLDYLFLLTIDEAENLFANDEVRCAKPTLYAKSEAYANSEGNAVWWLRSPGDDSNTAATVYTNGSVDIIGYDVDDGYNVVRPSCWIQLSNFEEKQQKELNNQEKIAKEEEKRKQEFLSKYGQQVFDKFGIIEKGNIITFGKYKGSPVTWKILDEKDGKFLITTEYGIDLDSYNSTGEASSWVTCSLRQSMNNEMFNEMFTQDEQNMVLPTMVNNDSYADTEDRLFLLSFQEVNSLFESSTERELKVTSYVKNIYGYGRNDDSEMWWLRSVLNKSHNYNPVIVYKDGEISLAGAYKPSSKMVIRPACWIGTTDNE